jgi:hypothetical protein
MNRFINSLSVLLFTLSAYSQQLSQVRLDNGATLAFFSIRTGQDVEIRLSPDGNLTEWGTEILSDRGYYYAPQLQPFLARTEYFDALSDSAFRGKVKSIGTCFINYYGAYEEEHKRGKLKSMGPLQFDYYSKYDEKNLQGKIKFIGNLIVDYYRSYENEAIRGKLKSIGSTAITYYSVFDDKYNVGKVKSIGPASYTWYSPFNSMYGGGGLKSNNYRQRISGVTYILQ